MLHAVIMAGGAGTRFWPESRALRPKQLLDFVGGRTMLQATVDRLGPLAPPERVLIVTNRQLVEPVREQLPQLPAEAILGEPCKRDTAPCIGLAALHVLRHDPDATMAVMPSDHVIRPDAAFQQALQAAAQLVDEKPTRIVTFGIKPSYAAESFGYIQRGTAHAPPSPSPGTPGEGRGEGSPRVPPATPLQVFQVGRFREKPKADVAKQYLASGDYYWNSGIFVWKARTIVDALTARQPQMVAHLQHIADALGSANYQQTLDREFAAIQPISIDYAIMEHYSEVLVIEAPFEWDDVGSWQALARLRGGDDQGNTIVALKHLGLNTSGTIVRGGDDHLIVTLGLKDCLVVHTPDATLVANKHDEESIRQLVKLMEERGWREYL